MKSQQAVCDHPRPGRLLIVLAGIIAGQAILYGPSLIGRKILLPLDALTAPGVYLPTGPGSGTLEPTHGPLQDLVYVLEPARRFAVSEFHAGRLPLWNPYQFAGAPSIRPLFSPFLLLQSCTASPIILAWTQMLAAIVAGFGAYVFCMKVLEVSYWPAAIASWCYPLTGFFVFWQGYHIALPVCWLPWILLAVDRTVREGGVSIVKCQVSSGWARVKQVLRACAPIGLSIATCLVVVSGQLDGAVMVLVVSGLFAVWCLIDERLKSNPARRNGMARSATHPVSPVASQPAFAPGPPTLDSRSTLDAPRSSSSSLAPLFRLALGWTLGLLLAAPAVLPVVDYARSGARMARRAHGEEERLPGQLSALPEIVLPDLYGRGLQLGIGGNQLESAATAYSGALMTLFAAPLAWTNRRLRSMNIFCILLALFGVSWCIGIPGIVHLLRLPGLNIVSHNRWVFATSFAVIALGATGLDELFQQRVRWRWWFWVAAGGLAAACVWSAVPAAMPPEPLATQLEVTLSQGKTIRWVHSLADVRNLKNSFVVHSAAAAFTCCIGLMGWLLLWSRTSPGARTALSAAPARSHSLDAKGRATTTRGARTFLSAATPEVLAASVRSHRLGASDVAADKNVRAPWPAWASLVLGALLCGELLWSAYGRCAQSEPALYYPPIPALQQLAQASPGRVIGYYCLPANLATVCGLRDIRGDDGVDPARLLDLSRFVTERATGASYALMQWLTPALFTTPNGDLRLSPILDMLGVRYVLFRNWIPPKTKPIFESADYQVLLNSSVMDRVYVPKRVEVLSDEALRLQKLASPDFNAREVAYVESPIDLTAVCQGQAAIVREVPTDIVVSAKMVTDGLLVLADRWDKGWRAYIGGKQVPILRANHAIRGVFLPKGDWNVEFRYEPASFAWGLRLACMAVAGLVLWTAVLMLKLKRETGT